jgi:hypothetical protein
MLGKWNIWHLMVYLGQSRRMCLTLSSVLQGAHTRGRLADRRLLCVGRVWPTFRRITTTSSWWTEQEKDLHRSVTDFTSHSLLPCVWSQYCCHFIRMCRWRAVLKSELKTPGTREPWVVASLAVASATSLPLIPTWPHIHASVILKSCLESVCEVVHSSK